MQLALPDAIYLVDAIEGGELLIQDCKPALESTNIIKVFHDCKRDGEALHFQYDIQLNNVFDAQIAYSLIEEQEGRKQSPNDHISFVGLLQILDTVDPEFWTYRPMSEMMIRAAADDVHLVLYIYHKMMERLDKKSLWHLALRSSLYYDLVAEGYLPEEEILSILNIPPGKMGQVIGKKGASIQSVKESCNAEIIIGGAKGPPDKVFIGPAKQVRKAEAILRGRMLDL